VTDWFDEHEDAQPSWTVEESWMRLYIVVGLIGVGVLGAIGGVLHVLPA
jgi:hypothetical protein